MKFSALKALAFIIMIAAGSYAVWLVVGESQTPEGRNYRAFFDRRAVSAAEIFSLDLGKPQDRVMDIIGGRTKVFDLRISHLINASGAEHSLEVGLGPSSDRPKGEPKVSIDWTELQANRFLFFYRIEKEGAEDYPVLEGLSVSAYALYTAQAMPGAPPLSKVVSDPMVRFDIEKSARAVEEIIKDFGQFKEPYDGLSGSNYSPTALRSMKSGVIAHASLSVFFVAIVRSHIKGLELAGINDERMASAKQLLAALEYEVRVVQGSWPLAYYLVIKAHPEIMASVRNMNLIQQIPFWASVAIMFSCLIYLTGQWRRLARVLHLAFDKATSPYRELWRIVWKAWHTARAKRLQTKKKAGGTKGSSPKSPKTRRCPADGVAVPSPRLVIPEVPAEVLPVCRETLPRFDFEPPARPKAECPILPEEDEREVLLDSLMDLSGGYRRLLDELLVRKAFCCLGSLDNLYHLLSTAYELHGHHGVGAVLSCLVDESVPVDLVRPKTEFARNIRNGRFFDQFVEFAPREEQTIG